MKNKGIALPIAETSGGIEMVIIGIIGLIFDLYIRNNLFYMISSLISITGGCIFATCGIVGIKVYLDDMRFAKSVMLSQGKVKIINDKDIR